MTHLKKNRFLSFSGSFLALTMLPTTAFAAELPEENHITPKNASMNSRGVLMKSNLNPREKQH